MPLVILLCPDAFTWTLSGLAALHPVQTLHFLSQTCSSPSFTSQSLQLHSSEYEDKTLVILNSSCSVSSRQISSALLWKLRTLLILSSVNPWSQCCQLLLSYAASLLVAFLKTVLRFLLRNKLHSVQHTPKSTIFTQTSDRVGKGLLGPLWYNAWLSLWSDTYHSPCPISYTDLLVFLKPADIFTY